MEGYAPSYGASFSYQQNAFLPYAEAQITSPDGSVFQGRHTNVCPGGAGGYTFFGIIVTSKGAQRQVLRWVDI